MPLAEMVEFGKTLTLNAVAVSSGMISLLSAKKIKIVKNFQCERAEGRMCRVGTENVQFHRYILYTVE